MTRKLVFTMLMLALSLAGAKPFRLTLFQDCVVSGTELKSGDYKLDLKDSSVVFSNGRKTVVESPVKIENSATKFRSTTVRYASGEGKPRIQEICLGGTNIRLVFNVGQR
jgi:hypothetical protein